MSDRPAAPPPPPGAVEVKDGPAPDPATPRRARVLADRFYRRLVRGTSFLDHPTPPREPTESQKFRANVLVTFLGSLIFGFTILVIQDGFRRSEAAIAADNQRLAFLNTELKEFSNTLPQTILLTYDMSKNDAIYRTRPQTDLDADPSPDGRTWKQVYDDFAAARRDHAARPQPDPLCRRVQFYLKTPAAREAVERFRLNLLRLYNATDLKDVEESMQLTNDSWDAAMAALAGEFTP